MNINTRKLFIQLIVCKILMANVSFKALVVIMLLMLGIFSITYTSSAYAQTTGAMQKKTTGGSLDILLEPSPEPLQNKGETKFKITFLSQC